MGEFNDFDLEIQDIKDSTPEHTNDTVTTAGTPITVQRTDNKQATLVYVKNPNKGTRKNDTNDVIYISIDGQDPEDEGTTLARGEFIYLPGPIADGDLKFDSNSDGTEI